MSWYVPYVSSYVPYVFYLFHVSSDVPYVSSYVPHVSSYVPYASYYVPHVSSYVPYTISRSDPLPLIFVIRFRTPPGLRSPPLPGTRSWEEASEGSRASTPNCSVRERRRAPAAQASHHCAQVGGPRRMIEGEGGGLWSWG